MIGAPVVVYVIEDWNVKAETSSSKYTCGDAKEEDEVVEGGSEFCHCACYFVRYFGFDSQVNSLGLYFRIYIYKLCGGGTRSRYDINIHSGIQNQAFAFKSQAIMIFTLSAANVRRGRVGFVMHTTSYSAMHSSFVSWHVEIPIRHIHTVQEHEDDESFVM